MVATLQQTHAQQQDGRHARRGGNGRWRQFHSSQALFETGHGRVAQPRVGVAILFASEARGCGLCAWLFVAAG